ncbi:MAG: hypothetical protein DSM106950_35210 [Stigonema ocellatum SAG 48.90 = DSM 106950]|nr:hypothetical protein [Stigonema ocellatum SAG 48.90 = DSM 106950]
MGRLDGQFEALLGQTIASVDRVALAQDDQSSLLMDTLLFSLTDTRRFELLVLQDTVRFEELPVTNGLFADFELEPGEQLMVCPTEEFDLKLPQTVASLTEIWASDGDTKFLVAISFWDHTRHHIISVCTEGDSAELMSLEELRQRTDEMVFSYGTLSYQLYTSYKEIKEAA